MWSCGAIFPGFLCDPFGALRDVLFAVLSAIGTPV